MDKDLGLFEMINAGDFATVSNNPSAAQGAASGANTFNFDEYNQNANAAEGQSADQFFNFGGGPSNQA